MCQKELEFVGFWLMTNGHEPLAFRTQGTIDVKPLKNKKEVRICMQIVNFIRNHMQRRAETLEPLTNLTKDDVPFQLTEREQQAFDASKAKIVEAVMLKHPRLDKDFEFYPDASDYQVGGALLQ